MEQADREFTLFKGGPFYRFFLAQRRPGASVMILVFVAWAPLLLLSIYGATAWGDRVRVPLLLDIANYARFFVSIPVVIFAERIVDSTTRAVIRDFRDSEMLSLEDRARFGECLNATVNLQCSSVIEAVLLVLAMMLSLARTRVELPLHVSTWKDYAPAFFWFVAVSIPINHFIAFRWMWRYALWYRLLTKLAQLRLNIMPSHPDLVGGLGILLVAQNTFNALVFAGSAAASGAIANSYVHAGDDVFAHRGQIITFVVLSFFFIHGPLFVFGPQLLKAKKRGNLQYSKLAESYSLLFQRKWVVNESPPAEPLLGTSDIQSLADIGQAFARVERMSILIINKGSVTFVSAAAMLPMIPLLLTKVSAKDLVLSVLKLVF